jgi:transcriptional regulator with XRE-family HTH domain
MRAEGLTATQVAELVGVHKSAVSRWLSGERRPSLILAVRIAVATDYAVTPKDWTDEDR